MRPDEQRTGLMFTTGKRVEVSLEKEDYHDVWFPALVLDSGNESFLVEYHSPGNTNKEGLVVVTVDHCHIRPTPPHLKDKKFGLLEKVDAFYDFGWWSGVITKELRDGRYIVFFKHSNKERKHNHSELRPHMEWKGGKWFTASQDISNPSTDHQGHTGKNNETTAATPCNGEESNSNPTEKYITKRTNPAETCYAFQNSYKKLKGCNVEKASSQSHNTIPLNRLGNNTINGGFASSTKINGGSEQPRVVGIQPSAKSGGLSCRKKVSAQEVGGELGNEASNTVNKREREPESQTSAPPALVRPKLKPSSSQASAGGKFSGVLQQFTRQRGKILGDAARKATEDLIEKDCVIKEVDIPVIQSSRNNGTGGSCARKPSQSPDKETQTLPRDQKQLVDDDRSRQKIVGSNELEGFAERTKKCLGSSILPAKSPEILVEVKKQNGDVAAVEPMVKDCTNDDIRCSVIAASTEASIPSKECRKLNGDGENQLNSPLKPEKQSTIMNKTPVKKIRPKRKCVLLASKKQLDEQHTSNRGRRRTISVNTNSPIQDSQNVSSVGKAAEITEKDVSVKVAEMERPSDWSDDQPFSMFIDGKQSPTTVDGPKCSIIRTVDECIERQKETSMELTAVNNKGESQRDENQSIPFVKNTLLWKTIESMEVFQVMPQKPHFRNLGSFKETYREGLAIGSMVNFSSVVENTSKLQYDVSRSIIEDNLDTLVELESFGFDVRLVRDRLTRLLLIKDKQEELEERSKEIKSRINEHDLETSNIDEEIDEIDKRIKELQERRAVAVSKKEKRGSEMKSLESTAECIDDGMRSARLDFVSLAAAPW